MNASCATDNQTASRTTTIHAPGRAVDHLHKAQRRNSFEDGVYGATCPIPPGRNFTYILQMKNQIGSFFYFPSLAFHKAAGCFGGIRILSRPLIPVPFEEPAGDFTVLIGGWYNANHTDLKARLDGGKKLPFLDVILINGRGPHDSVLTVDKDRRENTENDDALEYTNNLQR
ncbi:Monocopper oxidase-like protein SKU5 [Platanthera zijinensis]|uniref:Monocopper oxidase-like protein SKU5 n=1 Tax=Platanthera zijinensis TaxID=2320716 RepID=A0AAP0GF72_9ASPA